MRLIFIHGSGSSREAFGYQTSYFKNSEAIDLPGHPEGALCPTIDAYADWLQGYIQEKGYDKVVLAGHSLGGGIVLSYALKYPESLKGLILLGSGLRLRVHPMILETLEKAKTQPKLLEAIMAPMLTRIDRDRAETLMRRSLENGAAAMLNDMCACDQFNIMGKEKTIQVPTLAICGSEDVLTPPKYSHHMAEAIPNARAVIIEGGTHFVFAEKPEKVNQTIEGFLADIQE